MSSRTLLKPHWPQCASNRPGLLPSQDLCLANPSAWNVLSPESRMIHFFTSFKFYIKHHLPMKTFLKHPTEIVFTPHISYPPLFFSMGLIIFKYAIYLLNLGIVYLFSSECKLHQDRNFCLSCSLSYIPQYLDQSLEHSRYSTNMCWIIQLVKKMNE